MAGDWVKLHRKSLDSVVFENDAIWRLWSYLLMRANWDGRQLSDGTILQPGQLVCSYRLMAEYLGWTRRKVEHWLAKLRDTGCITTTIRHGMLPQVITICNWEVYQDLSNTPRDTPRDTSGDTTRDTSGDIKKKGRKKEGKKALPKPAVLFDPQKVELPSILGTPAFRAVWSEWVQHRSELRPKAALTPMSVKQQLKQFAEWGEHRAIAAIRYTILKGWRGIRESDSQPGKKPSRAPTDEDLEHWTPYGD